MANVQRDPSFTDGAFTGNFYIVNTKTNLAIQSERTNGKAWNEVNFLNDLEKTIALESNTTPINYTVIEGI